MGGVLAVRWLGAGVAERGEVRGLPGSQNLPLPGAARPPPRCEGLLGSSARSGMS